MIQKKEFAPDPDIPYLAAKELYRQIESLAACMREVTYYYPELGNASFKFEKAEETFNIALEEFEEKLKRTDQPK